MKETNFPYHLLNQPFWHDSGAALWPVSTFTLRRNFARSPFPHKQTASQAQCIVERLQEAFFKCPLVKEPLFLDFSHLTSTQKEFLFEYFLVPDGVFEDRPHQGLITDSSGTFLAGINLNDHLTLQIIDSKSAWHQAWNQLSGIDNAMSHALDYAFSPKFGYLTSNIHHCGTGLSIRAYLHLPALLYKEEDPFSSYADEDFMITQISHTEEDTTFQGDLTIVQNKYHLGISEDHLLRHLYASANRLINAEHTLRSTIKTEPSSEIKDLVSRAFGVLLHSYQITTKEALSALSLVKLGINLGWIKGIPDAQLNHLFFRCRRGHLLAKEQQELSHEELLHKRAELIHMALKEAKLII